MKPEKKPLGGMTTIKQGSCVSVQGTFVRRDPDGRVVVRVGNRLEKGWLVEGK